MFHRLKLFVIWPGNGQQEGRFLESLHLMFNRRAQRQYIAQRQIMCISLRREAYRPLQYLHGDCAIGMMIFHLGGLLQRDQYNPEI